MLITRKDENSLVDILKNYSDEINNEYSLDLEVFSYEFNELICELIEAIQSYEIVHATQIIDRFYLAWISNNMFSTALQAALEGAIITAVASVLIQSMSVQLASVSGFPLLTACGITLMALAVKIQVTTPQYVAVGTIDHGLFKYNCIKNRRSNYTYKLRYK